MEVSIDFETRSALNLPDTGAYAYSKHHTTDVWCMAYSVDGAEPELWLPGDPVPAWAHDADLRAWNAPFERVIWANVLVPRYGFPEAPLRRWTCTAAEARAMSLPDKLETAAKALRLSVLKDEQGHRLMLRMAKPRKVQPDGTIIWWDDPERRRRLYDYCLQDVRTETAVKHCVRRLPPAEREMWLLDQTINDRGIGVDMRLARAAADMAQRATDAINAEASELTGGLVTNVATDHGALARWLGVDSVAKDKVLALLAELPDDNPAAKVLRMRQEAGKSSVAKFRAVLDTACPDHRVRGALLYYGAGTGRWAGRLIQPHNFPSRGVLKHRIVERLIPMILEGNDAGIDLIYGPPMQVLSSALRATLIAGAGRELVAADYANIEGRVLAWMAGEQWRIDAFRDFDRGVGVDLYVLSYSRAFGVPVHLVDDAMRQLGKVMELALGYQGGVGAFQTMARGYGVEIEDERADELKVAWREASPAIKNWWYALERAAAQAVRDGRGEARGVTFGAEPGWLWCRLPSGRKLWYSSPTVRSEPTPWGREKDVVYVWGVDGVTKQWTRYNLYGGLLAENIVQAVARDLMAGGMLRAERAGYPVVMTVHDEIVAEVLENFGDVAEFERVITTLPRWAEGLPLTAKGWRGRRYRK